MQYDDIKVMTSWREVVPPEFFTFVPETPETTYDRTHFDRERGVYVFVAWGGYEALHELGHFVSAKMTYTLLQENFGLGPQDDADDEDRNVIPELRARMAAETLARCIDWRGFEDHWIFPRPDQNMTLASDGSTSKLNEGQLRHPLAEPLEREWLKDLPDFAQPDTVLRRLQRRKINLQALLPPGYSPAWENV